MSGIHEELGLGDPEAHCDRKTLKDFAGGRLPDREDEAVLEHLLACSGSCLAFLDSLPNPHQAVLRAIDRRHRPGRRR